VVSANLDHEYLEKLAFAEGWRYGGKSVLKE
jgi:hypothetical protein